MEIRITETLEVCTINEMVRGSPYKAVELESNVFGNTEGQIFVRTKCGLDVLLCFPPERPLPIVFPPENLKGTFTPIRGIVDIKLNIKSF